MAIPDYQALMRPVLVVAEQRPEWPIRDLVEAVAEHLAISPDDRSETIASGQGLWENRVQWSVTYLVKAGVLVRPRRAVVQLTDRGRELITSGSPINNKALDQYPEFRDFRRTRHQQQRAGEAESAPAELSPYDLLEQARADAESLLSAELLDRLRGLPPVHFERVVLRLLSAMGYGTGGSVDHTGKSGDGGFDGIVSQDPLGLDRIYVQAKRYSADNTVQAPAIREFVGALSVAQGERGVFLTTSSFSRGARDEADRVHKRLELVDGERLSQLMIRYGVGVQEQATVTLHRLDEDFFEQL